MPGPTRPSRVRLTGRERHRMSRSLHCHCELHERLGVASQRRRRLVNSIRVSVIGHLLVGDTKHLPMPLPPLVLAIAVLVLRVATI